MRIFALLAMTLVIGCAPEALKQNVDAMQRGLKVISVQSTEAPVQELAGNLADTGEAAVMYVGKPLAEVDIFDSAALADLKVQTEQARLTRDNLFRQVETYIYGVPLVGGIVMSIVGFMKNAKNRKALVSTVKAGNQIIQTLKDKDVALADKAKAIYKDVQAALPGTREVIDGVRLELAKKDEALNKT